MGAFARGSGVFCLAAVVNRITWATLRSGSFVPLRGKFWSFYEMSLLGLESLPHPADAKVCISFSIVMGFIKTPVKP